MGKTVQDIIKNENRKQPLTDEEIAQTLSMTRDRVKDIRERDQIPNSRERLYPYLYQDGKKIILEHPDISHRKLLEVLKMMGYSVSRHLALKILQEVTQEISQEFPRETSQESPQDLTQAPLQEAIVGNVQVRSPKNDSMTIVAEKKTILAEQTDSEDMENVFRQIIGYKGSLKLQIRQAQASTLYPTKGLHTLILGPSGVGKSQLAEAMHRFAIRTDNFLEDAPFLTFNCADYAENPQLLLSQLFGYVKGAFTGAEKEKSGIIEHANGGILFLDEIHRLPSEGQEILFSILDRGVYKKLGETEANHKASLMIIGATTENPESALLATFRRRIPMVIELPPLNKRQLSERYQLIKLFFKGEAQKINKDIIVDKEVVSMLLQYECIGNIGQLRSDIQVSCARGFLNTMLEKGTVLKIKSSDLANHVRIDMLNKKTRDPEVLKFTAKDLHFGFEDSAVDVEQDDRYVISDQIYQFIEERSLKLQHEGLKAEEINIVMGREIETEFENLAKSFSHHTEITELDLKGLVGTNITQIIDRCYHIALNYYPDLQRNFYYTLAIHMGAAYERIALGKVILNPHLDSIKVDYPNEYKVATILAEVINSELEIKLPEDEIGFIAMYIKTFLDKSTEKLKVGVVLLTHGKVGKAIADVVNKLLNTNHAVGLEMDLAESPKIALERTIEEIRRIDEGKGCVLFVDMGSLTTFGDIITKETGIAVKVIDRVDTVMVLDAVRKAIMTETTLEDITGGVEKSLLRNEASREQHYNYKDRPDAVITICITGEGSAEKMRLFVETVIQKMEKVIEVFPVGVISPIDVDIEIQRIMNKYNVLCFVGTIDPEYDGIPYISMERIFAGDGLQRLNNIISGSQTFDNEIRQIIRSDLILFDVEFKNKNDALDQMVNMLQTQGYVESEFLLDVYKREAISPTFLKGNIAIPHGYPKNVTKPAVMIARLKKPIEWHEKRTVDIIFLIAYKNNSKKYFKNFYKKIMNLEVLEMIRNAESKEKIKSLIIKNVEM